MPRLSNPPGVKQRSIPDGMSSSRVARRESDAPPHGDSREQGAIVYGGDVNVRRRGDRRDQGRGRASSSPSIWRSRPRWTGSSTRSITERRCGRHHREHRRLGARGTVPRRAGTLGQGDCDRLHRSGAYDRRFLPSLIERNAGGRIVTVSSDAGRVGGIGETFYSGRGRSHRLHQGAGPGGRATASPAIALPRDRQTPLCFMKASRIPNFREALHQGDSMRDSRKPQKSPMPSSSPRPPRDS